MENRYSINQIEVLSDIKAHTLRIWEKRYGIIEPKRTENNFRYFDEEDLKKILNISFLNKKGIKISKIADLPDEKIADKVLQVYNESKGDPQIMTLLSKALMTYDLAGFEKIFNDFLTERSFEECIFELIYPFFEKIGILWQANKICPAQEHLFSQFVKIKLCAEIEKIKTTPTKSRVLLYLREEEYHELGLLVYHYALKSKGYEVFNLGQSVPLENIEQSINTIKPHKVLTAFVAYLEGDSFKHYMDSLLRITKDQELFVYGNTDFLGSQPSKPNYTIINSLSDINSMF